jgi:hypothetical protein
MRNSADLVQEMLTEAKGAYLVAIAVGFSDDTRFVFSTERQPLRALNALITRGGSPIGLLRFDREGTAIQGSYRPFEEYAAQGWVQGYLAGLLEHTQDIVQLSRQAGDIPAAY